MPCHGGYVFKNLSTTYSELTIEAGFIDEIIHSRAKMYAEAVVTRLKVEVVSAGLSDGRIGMDIMVIRPLVGTLLEWVNQRI